MAGEGRFKRVTITRPANTTAYTAEDAVGDVGGSAILEFTNLLPPLGTFLLMSATLEYDVAALPSGCTFRLELYNASPTAIADNAAWDLVANDRALHIGSVTFGAPNDKGSTLKIDVDIINKLIVGGSGIAATKSSRSLYGILIASGGFTPAGNSETLALTLAGAPI